MSISLENQVVSLELAQKLKELDVKPEAVLREVKIRVAQYSYLRGAQAGYWTSPH